MAAGDTNVQDGVSACMCRRYVYGCITAGAECSGCVQACAGVPLQVTSADGCRCVQECQCGHHRAADAECGCVHCAGPQRAVCIGFRPRALRVPSVGVCRSVDDGHGAAGDGCIRQVWGVQG
eukprot:6283515-Pyramimonas_sp.AAC.1